MALPPYVVDIIQRRRGELRFARVDGVVFGSPRAKALRDPSNTAGDLRVVLDALGFDWVTSHVFRKTVATRLDEAGLSPRQIADQLGHSKPSMTLDVYMGRQVVSSDAARILDR
jgi:integrase